MTVTRVRKSVQLVGGDAAELGHRIECFLHAVASRKGTILNIEHKRSGLRSKHRATIVFQIPLEYRVREASTG